MHHTAMNQNSPPNISSAHNGRVGKKSKYNKYWCTGTTQRDGMGREEGGGFGMGNTCIPVADSF